MFIMPSEYTALQSHVKALETIVETLEDRIIALESSPAIEATRKIPLASGFPVGYNWDNFKPATAMMWPFLSELSRSINGEESRTVMNEGTGIG